MSHKAIKHLKSTIQEVKVLDTAHVPKTNECEMYVLFKLYRIISQSPDKSEPSDKPFHRTTYDLIQFNLTLNKDHWVSHFAYSFTNFSLIFIYAYKSNAISIIKETFAIIETQFNGKIMFFRSDREKSLGIEYKDFIASKKITYKFSAPDTPTQNGHSEQKKSILAMRARVMRIRAGLPSYL